MQAVKKTTSPKSSRPSRPARSSRRLDRPHETPSVSPSPESNSGANARRLTVYDVIDEDGKIIDTALSERDANAVANTGNEFAESLNAERIRVGKPAKPLRIWKVVATELVAAH